jgi:hypothetical protein
MHILPRRNIVLVTALALALLAGLLFALPKTYGSPVGDIRSADEDAFRTHHLALRADDYTTYTHPVHGVSFSYPTEYVLSSVVTDEGETVRAVSPRFVAGIEVTSLGVVAATNADEDTLPLIIRRVHPTLGQVADAWLTDGQEAYHVRVYAPRELWVDGVIREVVWALRSGELGK